MHCPQCNHDNPEGVKFCGECGAKLERLCPNCGSSNPPANKFCHQCGQRLVEPAVATPAPMPATTDYHSRLAAYTPKHLTEKVLTTRSALEGERRLVTVLFTDTAGFTTLAEKLDPEDVHQILDRCFELITAAVHRFEGTINQYTGDGVMALFGAPIAHEFERALAYAEQAKALALTIDAKNTLAASIFAMGIVHQVTGKLEEATRFWQESLSISRETQDKSVEGLSLQFLGFLHNSNHRTLAQCHTS